MNVSRAAFVYSVTPFATPSTAFAHGPPSAATNSRSLDASERKRREEEPTLQELRERSDAVLIVTMVSEGPASEGLRPEGREREPIVTTVAVLAVLAGDETNDVVEIVHARRSVKVADLSRRNPARFRSEIEWPDMIGVDLGGERLRYTACGDSHIVRPQYLVFLKRRQDGRFELTTGTFGNGSASVRLFDGREAR